MKKLAIFGVGLIGGSLALALKKAGNAPHIVGIGRNMQSLQEALQLGMIDEVASNIADTVKNADLILLAAPVAQTQSILRQISPHLSNHTLITDAGSTKSDVIANARMALGNKIHQFVPAHPIAGAEKSGASAAKADLFVGKNVVLTPLAENSADNIQMVRNFWLATQAKIYEMPAEIHDQVFATVSHLPHLLAFALVDEIASRENAQQLFGFAASGFRDFTRIAGSHPEMWRDISLANKTALLKEITAYQHKIQQLKQLIENEDARGLQTLLEHASKIRNDWGKSQ